MWNFARWCIERCVLLLTVVIGPACRPDLDVPPHVDRDDDPGWRVTVDPPGDGSRVPLVAQLRVAGRRDVDPESFVVVGGEVTEVQARYLEGGRLTEALEARRIPSRAYVDGDEIRVVPSIVLAPGPLTLVRLEEGVVARFDVEDDMLPRLERVFPPASSGAVPSALVYCGDASSEGSFGLSPGGPSGRLVPFAPGCLRFVVDVDAATEAPLASSWWGPPPRVELAVEGPRALDPTPLERDGCADVLPPSCEVDELSVGVTCVRVEDDRVHVRVGHEAVMVVVDVTDAAGNLVASTLGALGGAESPSATLRGLAPSTPYAIRIRTLACTGVASDETIGAFTEPRRDHLVVTEVLANPLGTEPDQEWVEIHNDGGAAVLLGAYTLADAGGAVSLPEATLLPGELALVVDAAFDETSPDDVMPSADCLLLRVPTLGKNGLSNEGERVALARDDVEVSSFPGKPRPQAGRSVARTTEGALEVGEPTPCAPYAPSSSASDVPDDEGAPEGAP